jgi:hypothetical protein
MAVLGKTGCRVPEIGHVQGIAGRLGGKTAGIDLAVGLDLDDLVCPHTPFRGKEVQPFVIGVVPVNKGHHGTVDVAIKIVTLGELLDKWVQLAPLFEGQALVLVPGPGATAGFEAQKDHILHSTFPDKTNQLLQVVKIGPADDAVHAYRDPATGEQLESAGSMCKTVHAAYSPIYTAYAVYAHVNVAKDAAAPGSLPVDVKAIGGHSGGEAPPAGVSSQFKEVAPGEGFPTAKGDGKDLHLRQCIQDSFYLSS